ncbi:MAG: hypothetical protein Q9218_004764 [Villophora microphyllina]
MESQRKRKPAPSMAKRLLTKWRPHSQIQVSGPVDDAVADGAKRYSSNPRAFLNDFNAAKRNRRIQLGEVFDLVIRLPHMPKSSNAQVVEVPYILIAMEEIGDG